MTGKDRWPAHNPGGCECLQCGAIFIGEPWRTLCAECVDHKPCVFRLHTALRILHWGATALSAELGVSDRTVHRWLFGTYQPPERVLIWLEDLAQCHVKRPAPKQEKTE